MSLTCDRKSYIDLKVAVIGFAHKQRLIKIKIFANELNYPSINDTIIRQTRFNFTPK
jgi:hypothetical protein